MSIIDIIMCGLTIYFSFSIATILICSAILAKKAEKRGS